MGPLHVLALVGWLADIGGAEALDRVVAVVDEHPIFLSELRQHARPHLNRVDAMGGDTKQRADLKAAATRETLDRMIEERLEEQQAEKAHLTVSSAEVDQGI